MRSTASLTCAAVRATMAMSAPASARASAIPSPSPRPPPVTTATRPSRRKEDMVNSLDMAGDLAGAWVFGAAAWPEPNMESGVTEGRAGLRLPSGWFPAGSVLHSPPSGGRKPATVARVRVECHTSLASRNFRRSRRLHTQPNPSARSIPDRDQSAPSWEQKCRTDQMARKLYVGNLPYDTGEQDLQALFGEAGTVESVSVMRDMATGRARGFAFVEMASEEDAQKAIEQLNNRQLGGRNLTVNEARPKPQGSGGYGGGGGGTRRRSEPRW